MQPSFFKYSFFKFPSKNILLRHDLAFPSQSDSVGKSNSLLNIRGDFSWKGHCGEQNYIYKYAIKYEELAK